MSRGLVALGTVVAALCAGAMYQRRGSRHDARRLPPPGRLVNVGGRRLHLYCLGTGPVSVIFEAGLAASSLNWRVLQQDVARFARACTYDRAGFGWSDRAPDARSARNGAADLHRLLGAARVPPPYVLVAHSFGCYVAAVFAATHASDLAGLVLVDPLTPGEWLHPDRVRRRLLVGGQFVSHVGAVLASVGIVRFLLARVPAQNSALPGLVLRLFGREADTVVRRVLGEVMKMPREVWPAIQAHWSGRSAFLSMAQHLRALPQSAADVHAALAHAAEAPDALRDVPIVVVTAADCPEHRIQLQRAFADLSTRGAHVRASLGGHWVHLDEPALVVDAIRRLVDDVAGGHRASAPTS